jgi:hypothetical protein
VRNRRPNAGSSSAELPLSSRDPVAITDTLISPSATDTLLGA